jgi:hypothetical protein
MIRAPVRHRMTRPGRQPHHIAAAMPWTATTTTVNKLCNTSKKGDFNIVALMFF